MGTWVNVMAEYVEKNIEETIPILEELQKIGLFKQEEVRIIVKRKRVYEYRIVRRQKQKRDFLRYIQYNLDLLFLIGKRRKKQGFFSRKHEIEFFIVNKIHKLFKKTCSLYPDDLKIWLSHILFSKKWLNHSELSKQFTKALQIHSRNEGLWINAAKFELEDKNSIENARNLLFRALQNFNCSKKIWLEAFRLELLAIEKQKKRMKIINMEKEDKLDCQNVSDDFLEGKTAIIVYLKASEASPEDLLFHLKFLEVCHKFIFSHNIQAFIFDNLQKKHGNSEELWNFKARAHLTLMGGETDNSTIHDRSDEKRNTLLESNEKCFCVFEEAVNKCLTSKMWHFYVKTCLEKLKLMTIPDVNKQYLIRTLAVFIEFHEKHSLSEIDFFQWANVLLLSGQRENLVKLLEKSLLAHSNSFQLWQLYIRILIFDGGLPKNMENGQTFDLIKRALNHLKENEYFSLWKQAIEWCSKYYPEGIVALIEDSIKIINSQEVYLDWIMLNDDIHILRKIYKKLRLSHPVSLNFFRKYILIEKSQMSICFDKIEKGYEDAIKEYGTINSDIWIEFINTYSEFNPRRTDKIGQLYWRAIQMLREDLAVKFRDTYSLLQVGC